MESQVEIETAYKALRNAVVLSISIWIMRREDDRSRSDMGRALSDAADLIENNRDAYPEPCDLYMVRNLADILGGTVPPRAPKLIFNSRKRYKLWA